MPTTAGLRIERGEVQQAMQFFEAALRNGSPFEAFHLAAGVHARTARLPAEQGGRSGMCGVGVAWYKLVAEKVRVGSCITIVRSVLFLSQVAWSLLYGTDRPC